jgi:hypothetical protein
MMLEERRRRIRRHHPVPLLLYAGATRAVHGRPGPDSCMVFAVREGLRKQVVIMWFGF